jgi:hypothetical protein
MANSKLLKEAIADAKAVKETALANAKIALEEAFTPRLQSILSQKMRAEAEAQDDDAEMKTEELDSSNIGGSNTTGETPGTQPTLDADTDLSVGVKKDGGKPEQAGTDYKKVADINEDEENPFKKDAQSEKFTMGDESDKDAEIAELKARLAELEGTSDEDSNDMSDEYSMDPDSEDDTHDIANHEGDDAIGDDSEDDMDLEAIIRELEAQLEGDDMDDAKQDDMDEEKEEDESMYEDAYSDGSTSGTDKGEDPKLVKVEQQDVTNATVKGKIGSFDNVDETIDLDEILREMEADMKDDKDKVDEAEDAEEKEKELNEAYAVIKSLQKTINEVNLLNAKLLFANKLFRANNMTNEQKVKVIETLDRTKSVREVKLVYSTLAENFRSASTTTKSTKKSMTEGIASKVTKSTSPAQAPKQVIAENADFANRFKKLAGILK